MMKSDGFGEELVLLLLPEDLILEIFTYLPPISLLRFKSVSKTLQSLISNPDLLRRNAVQQFSSHHHPSSSAPTGCVLLNLGGLCSGFKILMISSPSPPPPLDGALDAGGGGGGGYDYSKLLQHLNDYRPEHDQQQQPPDDDDKVVSFKVIDSCNGLLLYSHSVTHKFFFNVNRASKRIWYVCNPITKDFIKLPALGGEEEEEEIEKFTDAKLVFDPLLSLTYKVVIWVNEYRAWKLYVYSSETRSWRLSVETNRNDLTYQILLRQASSFDFSAVLLNGVLYWRTLFGPNHASICYDVEKDSVWTLNYPKLPFQYASRVLIYFGVCGGGLRLIESRSKKWEDWEHSFPFSFNVMEMNQLQLQQQHQDYLQLQQQHQDHQDYTYMRQQHMKQQRDLWTVKYRVNIEEEGYYADLFRRKSIFDVFILDLYKTTTKAEGEEGEEMLLCTSNHKVIYFNLSDNIFGKELRNELSLADTKSNLLRYVNITLFPLIH